MAAQIVITEPSRRKRTVPLKQGQQVSIGRGTDNDVILADHQVSRSHCTIRWDAGGVRIEDSGSRNGTRVNSKPVTRSRTLRDGDVIDVGECSIRFIMLGTGPAVVGGGIISRRLVAVLAVAAFFAIGTAAGLYSDQIADLLTGAPPPEISAAPHLTVKSAPAGATVFLDNEYAGVTPVRLMPDGGPHSLRLVLSGYESYSQAVELRGKPDGIDIDVELVPIELAVIEITSEPADAEVLLNGDKVGLSPIRVEAAPGTYEILIQKINYLPWKDTIEVGPGQTLKIFGEMEHRSIASYLKILEEDPSDVSAYCQLAHYYILERRHVEACEALRNAMEVFAQGQDTSNYGGRMKWLLEKIYFEDYFDVGNPDQHAKMQEWIIALYREMIKKHSQRKGNMERWLTAILNRAGRKAEVNAIFKPGEPDLGIYFQAADIYLDKRKYARAVGILNKAINLGPENFEARLKLGQAYLKWCKNGKAEVKKDAVKNLEKALELCKDAKQKKEILKLRAMAAKL